MNATESLNALLQQVEEIPEILGSAEDIMVDDEAMTLLITSIESITAQIRRSLQQGVVDTSIKLTEYLASHIAADTEASKQARSLMNERGYEAQAAYRLHEWVEGHMSALLSPLLCHNPYPSDWLDWMQQVMHIGLDQVDWNDLVERLRKALSSSLNEVEQKQ